MKLKQVTDAYYYYTEATSAGIRNVSFSGIGIVWVFCVITKDELMIPRDMILPLIGFIIALGLDLAHYAIGAKVYEDHIERIGEEAKANGDKLTEDTVVRTPKKIRKTVKNLYYSKLASLFFGMIALLYALYVRVI